ncbi:hypothetical protein [Natrinema halophilum]|uniref:Uncharacterized protein n=1 Tax=Natrinema halophilum TaxID=1699371 RepID=A0A7D5KKG9_9EURY|nr:hypothetical protein [Natrinema halophilum]QLG50419.1 hypothetical protein HYG82_16980 [Natrinema halophilum]
MTALLTIAWLAAAVNVALLLALGSIWLRNYRRHGASHTLGLLVFASLLLVQNGLWLYFYRLHSSYIGWFVNSGADIQVGMTLLCGLETLALIFVFRITWN